MINFNELLRTNEWYDNSTIMSIISCERRAYFYKLHKGIGVERRIGNGALFGTCFHKAREVYYRSWGKLSEKERRDGAFQAFATKHIELFGENPDPENIDKKHTLTKGLATFENYCQTHLKEDSLFRPISPEIRFIITIKPQPGDPEDFKIPFLYVGRIDDIWERLRDNTIWISEVKTSSMQPKTEIERLALDRQPVGYFVSVLEFLNENEKHRLQGVIADVTQVAATKFETERDFIHITEKRAQLWRLHTIYFIQRWREIKAKTDLNSKWEVEQNFPQRHNECFGKFGRCDMYEACRYGFDLLEGKEENKWNPITAE